jgi:hypothetical protein
MADIVGGPITVAGVHYTVILRPVVNGAAPAAPPAGVGAPPPAGAPDMMGGKRSKKQKQKQKGTRKLSPYMKFAQEARKKIIAEEPELKSDIIKVGRRIGEMWRGLSESEKAKY